jgi:glycerol-1-phosphate dehydrogenase [NAD(P)+]
MSVEIKYVDGKMIFSNIKCDCGFKHNLPDIDIYIGSNILGNTAKYLKSRNLGKKAVLVVDNITYEIAGRTVEKLMMESGFKVTLCLLEREDELEPDQTALGEVLLSLDKDTDFLIGVGSGTITDTTRYVASCTGRPFAIVGTAASMDGYTSVVAPLIFNGRKLQKPSTYPKVIICDTDIIRKAPEKMFISGVGDVLGKYVAKADWILGNIINGETYCPACAEIVMQAVDKCVANIDKIKNRTEEGTKRLIEALILAGVTILIVDNTRAVASIEHNMAHYWEMMKLAAKEKAPSHGTAVGVGTIYSLKFFDLFLKYDLSKINKEDIKNRRISREEREKFMLQSYGKSIGSAIMRDNPEDFLSWEEQERRIDVLINNLDRIKNEMKFLPTAEGMVEVMKKLGAPVKASEIGISEELLLTTLRCAKDYRSRYNLCKTLDEIGVLEELIKEM